MNKIYTTTTICRICNSPLREVLDLGDMYLNNFVEDDTLLYTAPLILMICVNRECELVQLKDTADPDKLYRQYWYQSGLNKGMVASLQDVVDSILCRIKLRPYDVIIDIGANDCTMLSQFPDNLYKVGFDPALNLKKIAEQRCNEFYNTYFNADIYLQNNPSARRAMIITSIAMFYDLENPNKFVEDIKKCLAENGIWVIQLADLVSMLKTNAFDAIGHEHLEYYSLKTLCYLMKKHGLEVFDVTTNNVNGGSIRVFISNPGNYEVSNSVTRFLEEENIYLSKFDDPFIAFSKRILEERLKLLQVLTTLRDKKIYVLGASTKGNTLLQYYGLSSKVLPFAAEVNKEKFGKKTVGTNITIISEEKAIEAQPDYFLVLPWHFRDGLISKVREAGYNGKFIFPLPEVEII